MRYILAVFIAAILSSTWLFAPVYAADNPQKCQELYPTSQANGYNGNCNYGYNLGTAGKNATECYTSNQGAQDACLAGWQAGRNESGNNTTDSQGNPTTPQNPTEPGAVPSSNQGNSCGRVKTSYVKCTTTSVPQKTEETTVWQALVVIMNVLLGAVAVVAVGGVVYGAVLYASAQDNVTQTQRAKEVIRNVIIGLVLYLLLWAIAQALIPGGVF